MQEFLTTVSKGGAHPPSERTGDPLSKIRTLLAVGLVLAMATMLSPAGAQDTGAADLTAQAALARTHLSGTDELTAADVDGSIVTDAYTDAHNGVTYVYLRQTVDGLPVLGAEATVNVLDGEVLLSGHHFVLDVADSATGEQALSADEALAAGALAVDADPMQARGAQLVYQALSSDSARLAWNLDVETATSWWNLSIDAETGEVLAQYDRVAQDTVHGITARTVRQDDTATAAAVIDPILPRQQADDGSSYNVFPMPMENPNDGPRVIVENPADARVSPFGWHDTDGQPGPEYTVTRGNNVNAYADTVPDNIADPLSQPSGGSGLDFDHPLERYDLTPLAYRDAAVDNLFYWNNIMHDVTGVYGFTEEAGNFQVFNYTGKGAGNDAVEAQAQDGSGVNNANFGTPADGSAPRMQMYIWPDTGETRDGDLDAGIIAHEYGHGVSNRLVGGPSNVSCLGSHDERQGEGWSDYWSYVLTMRDGDDGATPRGVGTYVLHQENRSGAGIRITPYSTDMTVNPTTYDRVKTAAEPHGVGYVWATMLWDLYWNLVEEHGFNPNVYDGWETGGNNLAIQLTVDGMKMAVCQPGFVDARNAIIAADAALTGGENECLIWSTFARRGLGFSADQANPASKTDGTEAFDVPVACE